MLQKKLPLEIAKIIEIFKPGGRLSFILKDYEARPQQERMLSKVVQAYNEEKIAIIEAATGTGKSLSYLLPAVLWALATNQKTLISTNTINLQEQLLSKDIPLISQIIGKDFKAVLVKGISNYLCLKKLDEVHDTPSLFDENPQEIAQIKKWSQTTPLGTRADLPFPVLSSSWERVMAEKDLCTGLKCPHYKECFFFKARNTAKDAHLLIANHHLLFADLANRQENNNWSSPQVLPLYQKVIIDEAHHIEDVALDFLLITSLN